MPKDDTTEDTIIETTDEEGNVVKFTLFDIVEYEKQEYALLLPVEAGDEESDEVVLMRLTNDGGEYLFEAIDDDNEFEKVSEYVESLSDDVEE